MRATEQTLALRKEGIGVVLDSELPHLIGIDDDLLSTGIILYHLKEGRTYVGREDAESEQDIVLHGLDLESEHCIFENLNGRVTLIPLNEAQCSVNGVQILEPSQLNQGAVILLGRTNMFRFNHPKEAAKLREKRKSGLLSSFSLSMTDLSKSCENLSAVMLYNPGLEFERQQREELEKLENKRKMIKEMEEKQRSEKAELEKMQQEVESQRKETEFVQIQIRKQEESLKRRSMHIETRMKDLLAEKEKFEEERLREQHEIKLQKMKQEEESFAKVQQELQRLQDLHSTEKAEKIEIFKELEKLKKEKDEQYLKLELEKRRLEEQEKEQLKLVFRLEEQLREKQEMIQLLKREDFLSLEEEIQVLEDVREDLLRAKEARSEGEEDPDEVEKATNKYNTFKRMQLEKLSSIVADLNQQTECLEHEIILDQDTLERLILSNVDHNREDDCSLTSTPVSEERDMIKQTEHRLHCKERQLQYIKQNHLPALVEEKQRASEILDSGLLGLDKTLYQIEKEIEEKADQLAQFRASSDQLQQLQETFEFTANIARQEEKVRKKEKEILESREKQHREALEQAVAKLERRHSALQRQSTIDVEIEEQKRKLAAMDSSQEQAGLQASLEAEQKALEQDRERLSQEIQQLKQKIQVTDPLSKNLSGALEEKPSLANSPASPVKSQSHLLQLSDDRIHAFIEEEVQRRLQNINLPNEDVSSLSLSYSSESAKGNDNFLNGINHRKIKYEANRRNTSILQIGTVSSPPAKQDRMVFNERRNLNPVTANLYSFFTQKCSDSQEKHLKEENEKGKNRSSISEYFDFLSDTEREPSHLLSRNLSNSKCAHQNISSASQQIPAKTKGKHLESVSSDRDFFKMKPDRTLFQRMPSSEMKTLDNEQPECNDIFHCNLLETNMLPENRLKENKCFCPTHQGILQQPHAYQRDSDVSSDSSFCQDTTHCKYSFQNLFSKFSSLYQERQLPTIKNVINQAKVLCSVQANSARNLPGLSFIKDLQFVNYFQFTKSNLKQEESDVLDPYENKVKVYAICPTSTRSTDSEKVMLFELSPRKETKVVRGHHGSKFEDVETGNVPLVPHTFLKFPNELLELRNCPIDEILDHFLATVPDLCMKKNECEKIYWLSFGNKSHPEPQPACLLLSTSNLSFVIFSDTEPMFVFSLPVNSLEELHIRFGGQSLQLLGSFGDSPVTVFTFDNCCTLQLCQVLTKMQVTDSDYAKYCSHPLLRRDLMELSTDWNADLSDLVFANGFKVTCSFKSSLADVAYLLHENTNCTKPALGDMHLLLYTSVRVEHVYGQCTYRSLALTNISIALVHDGFFQPNMSIASPSSSHFDQIKLHSLRDVKCIILADRDDLTKITIAFSNKDKKCNLELDENNLLSVISQSDLKESLSLPVDVWKLTLSSYKHALFLIRYLTF
ncbi:kinesin-like protein KIF16B isoform X2 [Eleutherodactylus coqui]|uniref:kinesin-like protein KIF16B isoform X2 n=1 Tax=Eleutherodactylus coqui TaxID=57060 RepID=UPI0034637A56